MQVTESWELLCCWYLMDTEFHWKTWKVLEMDNSDRCTTVSLLQNYAILKTKMINMVMYIWFKISLSLTHTQPEISSFGVSEMGLLSSGNNPSSVSQVQSPLQKGNSLSVLQLDLPEDNHFQFASGCNLKLSFEAAHLDLVSEKLPVSLIGPAWSGIIALSTKQKQKPAKWWLIS